MINVFIPTGFDRLSQRQNPYLPFFCEKRERKSRKKKTLKAVPSGSDSLQICLFICEVI